MEKIAGGLPCAAWQQMLEEIGFVDVKVGRPKAETAFIRIRWHATDGKPVCPRSGCETV
jgi:hypothetical protein